MGASPAEIQEILQSMENESRAITKGISELIYLMKGSLSWSEAWSLSQKSRNIMLKMINDLIEKQNK